MAGKLCMVMMLVMALLIMGCDLKTCNGMDTNGAKKGPSCFKNCIVKCGIDDYKCQLHCEAICNPPPSSLLKEEGIVAKQG
ncbi:unnamed protein product [Thlaspi arvense]|uniref:Uncharacterized protein n=1 Tax=Thlaspi arvense TaxID=13288 RepID=A0AAU9SDH2_THLAR|nr:unnamed protein product [Thlaspi arvense]